MSSFIASIAVLPFSSDGSDADADYFARGFADDLITQLTRFPSLRVVSSQSSFAVNTLEQSLADVMRQWELDYVLDGNVRLQGGGIRVTTRLVGADLQAVWAESVDATLGELFQVQDQVASMVAGHPTQRSATCPHA